METTPFSAHIWKSKYRYRHGDSVREQEIRDTWKRVARAVAAPEDQPSKWQRAFYGILSGYRFLPGGRILAGAGTAEHVTLFNCFVMGPIRDSMEGILGSLKEAALTMQQGGGIGCDFSALRPAGLPAQRSGTIATGPVSFMRLWDTLCETLMGTSARRGAMMATLRCDHPDIEAFIEAKRCKRALINFNLSVLITDEFMNAVAGDAEWDLRFPAPRPINEDNMPERHSNADACGSRRVHRHVSAKALWQRIVDSAHKTGEPGVLFIDSINRENNLYYCEKISATNPCGEIPLPPYGACNLGSLNLAAFVRQPFSKNAILDAHALNETVSIAVRFLDNVIDISRFPLQEQAQQSNDTRRIGLGITGLADMLAMLGLHYDSESGRAAAANAMRSIRDAAYASSIALAGEKGAFPLLDKQKYLQSAFVSRLPDALRAGIAKNGIRNSHLLAIAPAGTISLLAGNVSSGVEPIYAYEAERDIRDRNLKSHRFHLRDFAYDLWLNSAPAKAELPDYFALADSLSPEAHLEMQADLQQFVDNAISKTVNLPRDATLDDVANVYSGAYRLGVKGSTVFRSGLERGQVLRRRDELHCCHVDREAD
jgi:ribonucleoside-diphosphate reductase alpha chain